MKSVFLFLLLFTGLIDQTHANTNFKSSVNTHAIENNYQQISIQKFDFSATELIIKTFTKAEMPFMIEENEENEDENCSHHWKKNEQQSGCAKSNGFQQLIFHPSHKGSFSTNPSLSYHTTALHILFRVLRI